MTQIFSDDFESGDFSAWTDTYTEGSPTVSVVSNPVHQGSYAEKATTNSGSGRAMARKDITAQTEAYMRAYVRFSAFPNSGVELCYLGLRDYTENPTQAGIYNDGGTYKWRLRYWKVGWTDLFSTTPTPQLDTWFCVEIYMKVDATNGEVKMWVDGNLIVQDSGFDTTSGGNIDRVCSGIIYYGGSQSIDIYVDDVVVADTYIGPISGGGLSIPVAMRHYRNLRTAITPKLKFPKITPLRI